MDLPITEVLNLVKEDEQLVFTLVTKLLLK